MRATILLTLALLAAFQPGFSEKPDIEQLRQEAEQGDNEAQFGLGALYHYQKERELYTIVTFPLDTLSDLCYYSSINKRRIRHG